MSVNDVLANSLDSSLLFPTGFEHMTIYISFAQRCAKLRDEVRQSIVEVLDFIDTT